jgi:hypothetical protein
MKTPGRKLRERAKTGPMLVSAPASEPAAPVPASVTAAATAPEPEPTPPPVTVPPPAPKRITVEMRAADFFCSPSLDGEKPGIQPRYNTREGQHRVWCTMPGGQKESVAILDMVEKIEGVPFRVQIKRGPNNKPILDPDKTTRPRQPDPDPAGKPPGSGSLPR